MVSRVESVERSTHHWKSRWAFSNHFQARIKLLDEHIHSINIAPFRDIQGCSDTLMRAFVNTDSAVLIYCMTSRRWTWLGAVPFR